MNRIFEDNMNTAIQLSMQTYKPSTITLTEEIVNAKFPELTARHQKDTCTVCLEPLKRGLKMRQLPCFHYFHSNCLMEWLTKGNATCPVCRLHVQ